MVACVMVVVVNGALKVGTKYERIIHQLSVRA